ncbi:3735_t:CDS:2 [Paraglomus brasilianum]|uniref:3735_t:CDS:1 n=1 Tax=Paraglomus brasilianum TaxID=144538 RepID=A0A9N9G1I3_9GLOM|nr:3735_t:CDS:2 [Paraglomus brasilianum]
MIVKDTEKLNNLRSSVRDLSSRITSHRVAFGTKITVFKERFNDLEDIIYDVVNQNDRDSLKESLGKLKDSTEQIFQMINQQNGYMEECLRIMEDLLNYTTQMQARLTILSTYRDWVSSFKDALDYVPTISNKLKSILNSVGLTISDFEKLLDIKGGKSNIMFHGSENQSSEEARKQLDETAFPEDIAYIKNPLQKAFNALEAWENEKCHNIRTEVFVREQGCSIEGEIDDVLYHTINQHHLSLSLFLFYCISLLPIPTSTSICSPAKLRSTSDHSPLSPPHRLGLSVSILTFHDVQNRSASRSSQWRNSDYGLQLLSTAELYATSVLGMERCLLHAQVHKRNWYEKAGYTVEILEEGIEHVKMEKMLK